MMRLASPAALLALVFTLMGCVVVDDDDDREPLPSPIVADILSDPRVDGDVDGGGVVTIGAGTVLAGVSPTTGVEFRGFFSFPLASVPADASVQSASLELFVIDLDPLRTTPFTLDLVSFTPPLLASDFSRSGLPPLATRGFDLFAGDPGNIVRLDVTALVREAFRRGLPDGQFRLLLDENQNVGLVTVADPLASTATAPLLHIEYF